MTKAIYGRIYRIVLIFKSLFNKNIKIGKLECSGSARINIPFSKNKIGNIKIGKIIVNPNTFINIRENADFKVGDGTFFNNNCIITARKNISIGKNCLFGRNVMIFDHDHDIKADNMSNSFISKDIIIKDNVWVGANSVILKGVTIGQGAVIAAGSVVNVDVEDNVIFYNKRENAMKKIDKN